MKILSLCDYTGKMVQPWLDGGHECTIVDMQHAEGTIVQGNLTTIGCDIMDLSLDWDSYDVVFCFPPCTDLAVSGALHFKRKGLKALLHALTVVERCREICEDLVQTECWFIENPVSTISSYWRKPDHYFHPHEYTGWCKDDNYTKKTCLWTGSGFTLPPAFRDVVLGEPDGRILACSPGPDRVNIRSATPMGFATAVYNEHKDM